METILNWQDFWWQKSQICHKFRKIFIDILRLQSSDGYIDVDEGWLEVKVDGDKYGLLLRIHVINIKS